MRKAVHYPVIELVGVHAANMGATLMLEAAVDQLRARLPQALIAGSIHLPDALRQRLDLEAVLPAEDLGMRKTISGLWRSLRTPTVRRSQIDVILDISGFAYGDSWPIRKMRTRLLNPLRGAMNGRPRVILLPQAFGPFKRPKHAAMMGEAIDRAELIFARDQESLDHLRNLRPSAKNLRLGPDFTNLVKPKHSPMTAVEAVGYIVPNAKVPKAYPALAEPYLEFLRSAVETMRREAIEPRFLVHEGEGDALLAQKANSLLKEQAEIVRPADAVQAKVLLAQARCVVSSRYHALIGSLSSGVPSLACGWSHKYGALLADYGQAGMEVDLMSPGSWAELVKTTCDWSNAEELFQAAERERARARDMWTEVFDHLAAGPLSPEPSSPK